MEYLDAPMRQVDLLIAAHESETQDQIDVVVEVELVEIVDNDLEGFLDILADRVGNPLISNISYEVVGNKSNALYIRVQADTSEVIIDTSDWTIDECQHYLDFKGVDLDTVEVDDDDVDGWRNYVMNQTNGGITP